MHFLQRDSLVSNGFPMELMKALLLQLLMILTNPNLDFLQHLLQILFFYMMTELILASSSIYYSDQPELGFLLWVDRQTYYPLIFSMNFFHSYVLNKVRSRLYLRWFRDEIVSHYLNRIGIISSNQKDKLDTISGKKKTMNNNKVFGCMNISSLSYGINCEPKMSNNRWWIPHFNSSYIQIKNTKARYIA